MDMAALKQRIKDTVTMDDVLHRLGIELPANRKIVSIYRPDENTPSLHVYDQDFFCYATGNGGDQIRFVMDFTGSSYPHAVRYLAGMGNEFAVSRPRLRKQPRDLTALFEMEPEVMHGSWQHDLYLEMVKKWPIPDTVPTGWFGAKMTRHALWIPHWADDGKVYGIKTRRWEKDEKAAVTGSNFRQTLYRLFEDLTDPAHRTRPAILVEGESDVWTLEYAKTKYRGWPTFAVYGLPAGANTWNETYREQLLRHPRVYLALDSDEAGRAGTERILADLVPRMGWVGVLEVPGGRVAEALADGWNPVLDSARLVNLKSL